MAPPRVVWDEYRGRFLADASNQARSWRRHHRGRVVANRMRFVKDCMFLYQPGVDYRDFPWFTPGRFAKIHPRRVCSCSWCQVHYKRPTRSQLRRLISREDGDGEA